MQAVAAEMNLSETAFLAPRRPDDCDLRWFTPAVEVDLCGHATLASAHVLWETAGSRRREPRFHTRSGLLTAGAHGDWIELDFPASRRAARRAAGRAGRGARRAAEYVGHNPWTTSSRSDEATVRALEPDLALLARAAGARRDRHGAGVRPGVDFVSRFFAPRAGIDEDPVTGSAHCAWRRSGPRGSARTSWRATRRRAAAARCACASPATA